MIWVALSGSELDLFFLFKLSTMIPLRVAMPKLIAPAPRRAQESILPGTKLAPCVLPKTGQQLGETRFVWLSMSFRASVARLRKARIHKGGAQEILSL